MSAFREALKSGGYGEWIIETFTAAGEVRLRKLDDRRIDLTMAIPIRADAEEGIVLQAA